MLDRVFALLGGMFPDALTSGYHKRHILRPEGATMVVWEKSIRFQCVLAASLFVLVLAGCGDVSESGSSRKEEPSTSPPTETAESHAIAGGSADCKPTQPQML